MGPINVRFGGYFKKLGVITIHTSCVGHFIISRRFSHNFSNLRYYIILVSFCTFSFHYCIDIINIFNLNTVFNTVNIAYFIILQQRLQSSSIALVFLQLVVVQFICSRFTSLQFLPHFFRFFPFPSQCSQFLQKCFSCVNYRQQFFIKRALLLVLDLVCCAFSYPEPSGRTEQLICWLAGFFSY